MPVDTIIKVEADSFDTGKTIVKAEEKSPSMSPRMTDAADEPESFVSMASPRREKKLLHRRFVASDSSGSYDWEDGVAGSSSGALAPSYTWGGDSAAADEGKEDDGGDDADESSGSASQLSPEAERLRLRHKDIGQKYRAKLKHAFALLQQTLADANPDQQYLRDRMVYKVKLLDTAAETIERLEKQRGEMLAAAGKLDPMSPSPPRESPGSSPQEHPPSDEHGESTTDSKPPPGGSA